nr:MAG TPA: hypothetical protein [Caudoviricetes sp.]
MRVGICKERGIVVADDNALQYALERIAHGKPEEQQEFVEWFYSGNWVKEEENAN